ncbi:MAG: prepilin-type N-terminal cleavage/methylation domain-containing protein [Gemmatimonadales bacterium]|nr:MAG: prepilin-type N-terminal cleavage/methylation domain-containing protein [Gemmatimonadales bacterium]
MVRLQRIRTRRSGFTLLEMIVVIAIGGVLASIVTLSFSRVQGQMATRSAQSNFLSLHAQARALAVERGVTSQFAVVDATGLVTVRVGSNVVNQVNLTSEFAVTVATSGGGGGFTQCFTPRGIADLNCVTAARTVTFTRGDRSTQVEVLPLGQAR